MSKKECIAMLLAGGQGSRLGALTKEIAKPAVSFGGRYRIIDFALYPFCLRLQRKRVVHGMPVLLML